MSDIFCRVCKIRHILSVIHYLIRGYMCFQFTHFPCDDWGNIYTLSYYHHQIGSMNYYPLLRVRSWNNGVRRMSFGILMARYFIKKSFMRHDILFSHKSHPIRRRNGSAMKFFVRIFKKTDRVTTALHCNMIHVVVYSQSNSAAW